MPLRSNIGLKAAQASELARCMIGQNADSGLWKSSAKAVQSANEGIQGAITELFRSRSEKYPSHAGRRLRRSRNAREHEKASQRRCFRTTSVFNYAFTVSDAALRPAIRPCTTQRARPCRLNPPADSPPQYKPGMASPLRSITWALALMRKPERVS